jgi:2-oxoglutarate dehydrogenase E2 component (dihydrolipoamide succinyltransferase)
MEIEVKVPPSGESVQEGEIAEWLKNEGDRVAEDEEIVVIETDKVTVNLPAPAAGVLAKILARAGETVRVGQTIALIETEATAVKPPRAPEFKPKPKEEPAAPAKAEAEPLSPAVRRLVAEHGVDPSAISGTGKDGRIVKGDVLAHLERAAAALSAPPEAAPRVAGEAFRQEERKPVSRLRKRIAERLLASQRETATLTTFNEIDMSGVIDARTRVGEAFQKKHGVRLGFMSFFVKAAIEALKAFPAINAELDGDEIVYKNYADIGVAVSTDRGLVVPILRNAERLSFAETEIAIGELGKRARENRLTIEELTGGTFSITNGGIFGSLMSTPILNPPQSGFLGLHKV